VPARALPLQEEKLADLVRPADAQRPYLEAELERMRWIVRAYLRTRLHKLNTYAVAILDSPELKHRLSTAELAYVQGYAALVRDHVSSTVCERFQAGGDDFRKLRDGEDSKLLPSPRDSFVFCRVEEDVGDFDLGVGAGYAHALSAQWDDTLCRARAQRDAAACRTRAGTLLRAGQRPTACGAGCVVWGCVIAAPPRAAGADPATGSSAPAVCCP
jgi:hypothetical protein